MPPAAYDPHLDDGSSMIDSRQADGASPLAGVRILDLSGYIAGPYGCTLLADQGAEVIKIEPPEGDNLRKYPSTLAAEGRAFIGVNRGKLGIALDLKQPAGLEVLQRLVRTADVLVHNFRPSVPPRLGIDADNLRRVNPRLIYCTLNGYGASGPLKDKAGYDQVLQAMTGICAMQGPPGEPEIVYGSVVDYYAAALLAGGISSALYQRERTGEGQTVNISLMRSALAMQSARLVWAQGEGRDAYRDMRSGGITGLHPTKQGSLYLSANTPHFWKALCELIEEPQLASDERYDSVRKRAEHAGELVPRLRAALARRTALDWEERFGERVPCSAVREVEDMFDHPQALAENMIQEFEHPLVGRYRGFSRAMTFGSGDAAPARAAPVFAQHADEVLARAGYDKEQIDQLRRDAVIP
jgi:crotonobetainyl-CoA:carnitine CoA-transferase CaiB-like acyl-CoA transferase